MEDAAEIKGKNEKSFYNTQINPSEAKGKIMKELKYSVDENGRFIVNVEGDDGFCSVHELNTIPEIYDFIDGLKYSSRDGNGRREISQTIKEIKNMFQVQCLSTYGGPGLGKSTTALTTTANLKKCGIDADYTSEVAKEKVYGKNLNELKDQSGIIGEQIKRLNTLVKSRDVTIAVQDSPFILGIAYQNKEDPHVDEEDFKEFYVKQYLNYMNLNILLERKEGVEFQEVGREQNLEQSVALDNVIKREVLEDNGLVYINLPAYQASRYMVELGKTMDGLTIKERHDIYTSTEDKLQRSSNYHRVVLEKTIKNLEDGPVPVELISAELGMDEAKVLGVLQRYRSLGLDEYLPVREMVGLLRASLERINGQNKASI